MKTNQKMSFRGNFETLAATHNVRNVCVNDQKNIMTIIDET